MEKWDERSGHGLWREDANGSRYHVGFLASATLGLRSSLCSAYRKRSLAGRFSRLGKVRASSSLLSAYRKRSFGGCADRERFGNELPGCRRLLRGGSVEGTAAPSADRNRYSRFCGHRLLGWFAALRTMGCRLCFEGVFGVVPGHASVVCLGLVRIGTTALAACLARCAAGFLFRSFVRGFCRVDGRNLIKAMGYVV